MSSSAMVNLCVCHCKLFIYGRSILLLLGCLRSQFNPMFLQAMGFSNAFVRGLCRSDPVLSGILKGVMVLSVWRGCSEFNFYLFPVEYAYLPAP